MAYLSAPGQGGIPLLSRGWQRATEFRERLAQLERRIGIARLGDAPSDPASILILDDLYPSTISGFRRVEFDFYLSTDPNARVLTSGPGASGPRVQQMTPESVKRARGSLLGYAIMLNNAYSFLPYFEALRLPFAFACYPGGGFHLGTEVVDRRILAVTRSRYFRGVITTQRITQDYLLSRGFVTSDQVRHIFGAPLSMPVTSVDTNARQESASFNVCFVAHRYTPAGVDKGYPAFLEVAETLVRASGRFRFLVVGPFEDSLPLTPSLRHATTFYPSLANDALARVFETQHVIVSANAPFFLGPGSFDGFPTASCNEAGVRGVVVAATDPLGLNPGLQDGLDFLLIDHRNSRTAERIIQLERDRGAWAQLAQNGAKRLQALLSNDTQLGGRLDFLRSLGALPT